MSSVVLSGDSSGTVTLTVPSAAGTNTATLPARTGTVMLNGPAFSAYANAATSLSTGAATKVLFQATEFDTASCYNTSTSVFTPNVAGYYQFNVSVDMAGVALTNSYIAFYKNGSTFKYGFHINSQTYSLNLSSLIYCNGSTDYIEVYIYQTSAGSINTNPTNTGVYFQGALVRSA